ncbi:ran-specific GTPase-activating protein 30 [Diutina catenulata]
MDQILAKASNQAVSFAIRSGISLASGYAIKTIGKYVDSLPQGDRQRLMTKKKRLQQKIEVVTVSLDLVKLASGRNSVLETVLELVNDLFLKFNEFGDRVSKLESTTAKDAAKTVEKYMDELSEEISDVIPVINLCLATSGVNMNHNLAGLSPGSLIRAAHMMATAIPKFDVTMYTIFHSGTEGVEGLIWKETFARATASIEKKDERYQFSITESFDDGRYHDDEDKPLVKKYAIGEVSRMFYTVSGKLLRLESRDTPVLILKIHRESGDEWIALGQYDQEEDSDSDSETESEDEDNEPRSTELTLLEYLIRLTKAEDSQQQSVLEMKDEVLAAYLADELAPVSAAAPATKREQSKADNRKKNIIADSTMKKNVEKLDKLKLDS